MFPKWSDEREDEHDPVAEADHETHGQRKSFVGRYVTFNQTRTDEKYRTHREQLAAARHRSPERFDAAEVAGPRNRFADVEADSTGNADNAELHEPVGSDELEQPSG